MKLIRTVIAALMVGVLLGGHSATPSDAATKSKTTSVLSKMTTGTKNFFSSILGGKKTTKTKTKKKSTK